MTILVLNFGEVRTRDKALFSPEEALESFGVVEALNVADRIIVHVQGPKIWHLGNIDGANAVSGDVEDLESKKWSR